MSDTGKTIAGTLVIYGAFCIVMTGMFAWYLQNRRKAGDRLNEKMLAVWAEQVPRESGVNHD